MFESGKLEHESSSNQLAITDSSQGNTRASPPQTVGGKDTPNPLTAVALPKSKKKSSHGRRKPTQLPCAAF